MAVLTFNPKTFAVGTQINVHFYSTIQIADTLLSAIQIVHYAPVPIIATQCLNLFIIQIIYQFAND